MKLLFDHNISPKLVTRLAEQYPESSHVVLLALDKASDLQVWQFAHDNGYCLVTKDADFDELIAAKGFPPKVIWLKLGNCTTSQVVELLKSQYDFIIEFLEDERVGLLELQ